MIICGAGWQRILGLYLITFCIVLPYLCHKSKHSVYYSGWAKRTLESRLQDQRLSNDRKLKAAKNYFSTLTTELNHRISKSVNMHMTEQHGDLDHTVVITIITLNRNSSRSPRSQSPGELGYLTQTFAGLHKLFKETPDLVKTLKVKLAICNVDGDAHRHKEVPTVEPFADTVFTRFPEDRYFLDTDKKQKEKDDYVFCLNASLHLDPQFVLLVEDDAVPTPQLPSALEWLSVEKFGTKHKERGFDITKTAFIKLYHPERLAGFFSSIHAFAELILASLIVGVGLTLCCTYYIRNRPTCCKSAMVLYLKVLGFWTLYDILVILCIGRQTLLEVHSQVLPRTFHLLPCPHCCTPAVLFPKHSVGQIVKFLADKLCMDHYSKDNALDDFVSLDPTLQAFLVQPNVFEHIGFYSAVRHKFVDPIIV